MGLPSKAKTELQAKKDKAETDRAAAHATGASSVEAAANRTKAECDRMATFHADQLS